MVSMPRDRATNEIMSGTYIESRSTENAKSIAKGTMEAGNDISTPPAARDENITPWIPRKANNLALSTFLLGIKKNISDDKSAAA